jgi:hypothetical protein
MSDDQIRSINIMRQAPVNRVMNKGRLIFVKKNSLKSFNGESINNSAYEYTSVMVL